MSGQKLQDEIMYLYKKYSVFDEICNEARALERQTIDLISELYKVSHCTGCVDDFEMFVKEMINVCFSRLG